MIAAGLQSFGGRVEDERYVATGLELVDLLDRELAAELSPVSAQGPRSERTNWSTRGVVHLAKLVQALDPLVDRRTSQAVGQLLLDLHRQERTILVVVTHSADLAKLFPRQMEMADGALQTTS